MLAAQQNKTRTVAMQLRKGADVNRSTRKVCQKLRYYHLQVVARLRHPATKLSLNKHTADRSGGERLLGQGRQQRHP